MNIVKISIKLFGRLSEAVAKKTEIERYLKVSNLRFTYLEYISLAFFFFFLSFIFNFFLFLFLILFTLKNLLTSLILSLAISILISSAIFLIILRLPYKIFLKRENEVEKNILNSIISIYPFLISGIKTSKSISFFLKESKSKEINSLLEKIWVDIENYGLKERDAIKKSLEKTRSKYIKNFLKGLENKERAKFNSKKILYSKINEIETFLKNVFYLNLGFQTLIFLTLIFLSYFSTNLKNPFYLNLIFLILPFHFLFYLNLIKRRVKP